MRLRKATGVLLLALCMLAGSALAEYDAQTANGWLEQFAAAIAQMQPQNDVQATADPARAGEYLMQYGFGTVAAKTPNAPAVQDILRIELKNGEVTDCRGLSVGQALEDVIAGREIGASDTPLYVLATQESGYGWSWAYVSANGVYGVEYITYGGDALSMKEYTLTYVIENDRISAIRMQIADATLAQAEEGLRTAEEIAGRQQGEVLAVENVQHEFEEADLTIGDRRVIGVPVEELVAAIGEPQEVQTLPSGFGRMLIYADALVELVFDEMTGVEHVRAVSCAGGSLIGPRGLQVGMSLQEAAALFRCDGNVYSTGGALYLAGEAQGIAPYGEILRGEAGLYTLRYTCVMDSGATGMLDIVVADGVVSHWYLVERTTEAAYGG